MHTQYGMEHHTHTHTHTHTNAHTHTHTQMTNVRSCHERPRPPQVIDWSLCTTQGTLGLCYNKLLKLGQVLAGALYCTNQLWCGHMKSNLDHCGIMAQTLVLSPPLNKVIGTHLQLGELETRRKIPHIPFPHFLHIVSTHRWYRTPNHQVGSWRS